MKLSREEVLHIALLARLGLTDAEIDRLREQLSDILENFEILQQVDTSGIPPTAQSIPLQNVMKRDEAAHTRGGRQAAGDRGGGEAPKGSWQNQGRETGHPGQL